MMPYVYSESAVRSLIIIIIIIIIIKHIIYKGCGGESDDWKAICFRE